MIKLGKELIFISKIQRDGKGIEMLDLNKRSSFIDESVFTLNSLSVSRATYIAQGNGNSYVVKIRN